MPMWPTQGQQQVIGPSGPQTIAYGNLFWHASTRGDSSRHMTVTDLAPLVVISSSRSAASGFLISWTKFAGETEFEYKRLRL